MMTTGPGPAPFTPTGRRRSIAGFTFFELILVISVVGILGGLFLVALRPDAHASVEAEARGMAAALRAAVEQASAREGEMVMEVSTTPVGSDHGRYLALAGAEGVSASSVEPSAWYLIEGDLRWGPGSATTGPTGLPTDAGIPHRVRCDAERRCWIAGGIALYYLTRATDPEAVYAVSLTEDATVQVHRYEAGTATWKTLTR